MLQTYSNKSETLLRQGQNNLPPCFQTSSAQCSSYSPAPLFYKGAVERYSKRGSLLLEEIHPDYNSEEHS